MPTLDRGAGRTAADPSPRRTGWAAVAAAPTVLAAVLLIVAISSHGAFAIRHWGPLAVFSLVVLAVARPAPASRAALVMVAAAWGYALWSLLSVTWAEVPGNAIQGAARNFLYAGLISLPVLTLPSRAWAVRVGQLIAVALGVVVAGTFVALHADGAAQFLAGRLDDPVGYRNATAALFALAYWPLAAVAARRATHPLLRAAAFAAALGALGLAFLTQSRGVVLGFAVGGIVAIALGPDRIRRAWITVLALVPLAVLSHVLLEPWNAFLASNATSPAAVGRAVDALTVLVLVGFGVALAVALLDGGLRLSAARTRVAQGVATGLLVLIALGALGAGLAKIGNPVDYARTKVDEFRQLDPTAPTGTRLGSTSGQRYDLWRIAWAEFRSKPVTGVGEGSYEPGYYARRATDRNLDTPHSLPLEVLAETGLVGALLLAGVIAGGAAALASGWRRATPDERRWASALAAAGAVMLSQSVVDWFWLIPGLSGLGLLCFATAVAVLARPRAPEAVRELPWLPLRLMPLLAALLVVALTVSDLYVRTARDDTASSSARRLSLARTAADLDPFADPPRYLEASALEEQGRRGAARGVLLDVLHREPRSFVAMALLGDLETRAGHRAAARRWYRRALAENPRDTGLRQLANR